MEINLITLSGIIMSILLGIIGFFLTRLINDVRRCSIETGKNKGRIDLIAKQQENDVKRIELTTQLELQALTKNVNQLSSNVQELVVILAQNGIKQK